MSAEFFIRFKDINNYKALRVRLIAESEKLRSYVKTVSSNQVWLKEKLMTQDRWDFDTRIFFDDTNILLEISGTSKIVHADLVTFIRNIRSYAELQLMDEDGESINFFD